MKVSVLALFFAALVAAGVAAATARFRPAHHHRSARSHVLRMTAPQSVSRNAYPSVPLAQRDDRIPTHLEYRFGHGRVLGAVGYNRVVNSYEINPHEVNSAASTQLGHPDATVGARVSVPF